MALAPLSLTDDDFDTLEQCAPDLQHRLSWFARAAVARMRAEGFDASVHFRVAGVRFVPDGSHQEGLQLGVDLDAAGIEVSLRLPSSLPRCLDWQNLRECARQAETSLQLTTGEPAAIGMSVPPEALRLVLERCEQSGVPLWVGWRVARDVAVSYTENLDEELEDALLALVPVARFVVWDEGNDYLAHKPSRSKITELDARDADDDEAKPRVRQRIAPELDEADDEGGEPEVHVPFPPFRPPAPPAALRFLRRAALVTEIDPTIVVERGTRVRVLVGPFVGKVGTVTDLDSRGRARVLLGLLSTTCNVRDLIAAHERDRRPLMSSHRRMK
jgi:hypothetical protein